MPVPTTPFNPGGNWACLRAVAMLPGLDIHSSGNKRCPLVEPTPGLPTGLLFRDSEEKGQT